MAAKVDKNGLRAKLLKLFAMLGTSNPNERTTAFSKIDEILLARKLTWNDFTELMQAGADTQNEDGWNLDPEPDDHDEAPAPHFEAFELFDRVCETLDTFLYLKRPPTHPREADASGGADALPQHAYGPQTVAVALWIMHTFVFKQFMITPRLALLSPVRGCGKSTLLDVLERLVLKPAKYDHTSAAGIYHVIDKGPTLLLDEVDNLELDSQPVIRSVLNSGHKEGGKKRIAEREFSTFAPAAFGTIGILPAPLMHRSVVIHMERAQRTSKLERFDTKNVGQMQRLRDLYCALFHWSRQVALACDPPMPARLYNRRADNWRPLLAIADACGRGELAREAALAMSREHQDEDPTVELLGDIRKVFDRLGVDRLHGRDLVSELHDLEGAPWREWRGARSNQQPRELSQAGLAMQLRSFGIFPISIWPIGPRAGSKCAKGYLRRDFEAAWQSYCDATDAEDDTPEQPSKAADQGAMVGPRLRAISSL